MPLYQSNGRRKRRAVSPTSPAAFGDERLGVGLRDAAVAICQLDEAGFVVFANRRFESAIGGPDLVGRRLADVRPDAAPCDREGRADTVVTRFGGAGETVREIVWTRNAAGGWIGVVASARDVEALGQPEAETDPITGLATRAHLAEAYGHLVRADVPGHDVAMLYVDVDHFRRATEMLARDRIDSLLRKIAQRLRQAVRTQDSVARLEEDDFAVVLSSAGGRETATEVAERICEIMSRPFLLGGEQIAVGASVGLAVRSQGDGSFDDLLRLAAIAMQHGRKIGYGRVHWFEDAMADAIRERHFIETGLRRALLLEEFELYYQPQFSFADRAISGFEALVRWRHPERGVISPASFIPVAEECGLMTQIGTWVLREACLHAAGWPGDLMIAVNVSPVQFELGGFVDIVAEALEQSGLDPRRLELELTEAVLLTDSEETVEKMNAIRSLGVKLALDDFGTGYSSLNYLRQFPFDKIKMDQSYVRGPGADTAAHRIVAAVAELGESFGMKVLAEGVETEEQLESMRLRGCTSVQGYLFSRPIPGADIPSFLTQFTQGADVGGAEGADR